MGRTHRHVKIILRVNIVVVAGPVILNNLTDFCKFFCVSILANE